MSEKQQQQEHQHHHHHHHHHTAEEKEKKKKKQRKRMGKILSRAWEMDENDTRAFQEHKKHSSSTSYVTCLASIGHKLDEDMYRLGRHGWEDFAADIGGVYNRHIRRNTKKAALAKKHLEKVKELLGVKDQSLVEAATNHVPKEPPDIKNKSSGKKRKSISEDTAGTTGAPLSPNSRRKKAKLKNQNSELAAREERAMEQLANFMTENGGDVADIDGFSSRVTRKQQNKFDVTFYHPEGQRFRSMLAVGRYFNLAVRAGSNRGGAGNRGGGRKMIKRGMSSRETQAEKKRLRKELDRLRKTHQRASKALDDFLSEDKDARYPIDDRVLLIEEEQKQQNSNTSGDNNEKKASSAATTTKTTTTSALLSAAARVPDIDGFPGTNLPQHCIPDLLQAWDFLYTFQRALSLSPITSLDDFASALAYTPPEGQLGDDVVAPPVYIAEAHLALIKLLLQDGYSDDWWWANLETDEVTESGAGGPATPVADDAAALLDDGDGDIDDEQGQQQVGTKPVIIVNFAALINEPEDPLITSSWIRSLEDVGKTIVKDDEIRKAIKTALKVASNKWVRAYLRKTLSHSRSKKQTCEDKFVQKAVRFLVDHVRLACPDLQDRSKKCDDIAQAKQKVVEDVIKRMEALSSDTAGSSSVPSVTSDDVHSDAEEEDEDEESDDEDDSDDEEGENNKSENKQTTSEKETVVAEAEKPASCIPPRPPPSFVDLLLPPAKPHHNSDFINPFTWPHVVGATAHRVLHRKKRLYNEVDDYMRSTKGLSPILIPERRGREKEIASRVLTECAEINEDYSPTEKAIDHLCSGGNYLQLSIVERLCILRLLIEATYDTSRVYEVVNGNIKQRTNAIKALEVEQRRAKREAKEKASSDDAAAREELAREAKDSFFDDKREEIRKLNEKNKEFTDEDIEALTEEDILDFDEDFKADYDELPKPESFNKTQVKAMVVRMQEEAAFDCDSLRVLTMDELVERDKRQLEELEGQLVGFGGPDALLVESMDRETTRSIERLQRDIAKAKDMAEKLPAMREKALEQLKDAMGDGTIKVLRSAVSAAKKAKLSGPDDETGGVWAVDLMRDAAIELENAKQNKRVLDAQRDLVAKMNKCFIRTEAMGHDRFGNRWWGFDNDEDGHVWAEAEYLPKEENEKPNPKPPRGFLDLVKDGSSIACGARDMEEDLMGKDDVKNAEAFKSFSRREYHSTGFTPTLAKNHWGCHATEESIRSMIKILDSRGLREVELKKKLKEAVEKVSVEQAAEGDEKLVAKEETTEEVEAQNAEAADAELNHVNEDGDEEAFKAAKQSFSESVSQNASTSQDEASLEPIVNQSTAIGLRVRYRQIIQAGSNKDPTIARYETGLVTGWKYRQEEVEVRDESDEELFEPKLEVVKVPIWRVSTNRGHCHWLTGPELIECANRHHKMMSGKGYFEDDSAFFAYRNSLGKYCGKASDAPFSSSPIFFARHMVKREGELYPKLKIGVYNNNWGGKSGSRALWTNSMKDYAFDLHTVRQGLLTLEKAFFELTGEFSGYENVKQDHPDVKSLLANPEARHDVELETIEKGTPGLWNNPTSRQVYIEIVKSCSTTGFLALALDLLCRNTTRYLQAHKLMNVKTESDFYEESLTANRRTRGMNAWQRKQPISYEEFF